MGGRGSLSELSKILEKRKNKNRKMNTNKKPTLISQDVGNPTSFRSRGIAIYIYLKPFFFLPWIPFSFLKLWRELSFIHNNILSQYS